MADKLLVDGFVGTAQILAGRTPTFIAGGSSWVQRAFPSDSDYGALGINGSARVVPLSAAGGQFTGNGSIDILFAGLTNLDEIRIDFITQLPLNTTAAVIVRELTAADTIGNVRMSATLVGNSTNVGATVGGTNAVGFSWSGGSNYGLSEAFARGEMSWQIVMLPEGNTSEPSGYVGVVGPSGLTAASHSSANFASDGAGKYTGYGIRVYVRLIQNGGTLGPPLFSSLSANGLGDAPPDAIIRSNNFLDEFTGTGTLVGHVPVIPWGTRAWITSSSGTTPSLSSGEVVLGASGSGIQNSAQYGFFFPPPSPEGAIGRDSAFSIEFDIVAGTFSNEFNDLFSMAFMLSDIDTATNSDFSVGWQQKSGGGVLYAYSSIGDYQETDIFTSPFPGTAATGTIKLGADGVLSIAVFGQLASVAFDWATSLPGYDLIGMRLNGSGGQRVSRIEWMTGVAPPEPPPNAFWTGFRNTREII